MKTILISLFIGFTLCLATSAAKPKLDGTSRSPNILFVLIDNLGKDWFDCYGSVEGQTPNIDKLAETGIRFEHCYTTAICSTARAVILTGRYSFRTGWHTHHDTAIYGGGYLDWNRETLFPRILRSAGYATCITGKWQLNDFYDPAQRDFLDHHGFDEYLLWTGAIFGKGTAEERWKKSVADGYTTDRRIIESRYYDPIVFKNGKRIEAKGEFGPALYVDYLIDFMGRHRDTPFLAYYSSPSVHRPLIPTPLNPGDEGADDRTLWAGMVRYVDHQVGQLVGALDTFGLRENTIVVVTTDNGTWSGLGGNTTRGLVDGGLGKTTEAGLDVPLIVNCPRLIPKGRVSNALIDGSDFLPTFAELGGAALPPDLKIDGRSFADLIRGTGKDEEHRKWVYSQHADLRILRDDRFKLYSTGRFFDLANDFLEKNDLAGSRDAEIAAARASLQATLDSLPADLHLPWEPRSGFAFRLREKK